jgi:nucleotide-binding universal stress UspA family protein
MKTILIPVDFSAAAENAIRYTSELIKDIPVSRIILMNSYVVSKYAELVPVGEFGQFETENAQEERREIETNLQEVAEQFEKLCDPSVQVRTEISELPIVRAIHEITQIQKVNLLVLGSDYPNRSNESLISRQLIEIAKSSKAPVLIIPSDVQYKKPERALVPCNFRTINRLSLLKDFQRAAGWLQAELLLLNINPPEKLIWRDGQHQHTVQNILQDCTYKLCDSENPDILQAISDFAKVNDVQLTVSLPGKRSFFYRLTHRDITKAIMLNSRQPVLLLKD